MKPKNMQLFTRCALIREESPPWLVGESKKFCGPKDVARLMKAAGYTDSPQEHFVAFLVDARHELVGMIEVSRGTIDASLVHPREVFRAAILANAAAILVAHNHPSGDIKSSSDDREVTRKLQSAGELIGIALLDHVIVGSGGYVALRENGEMA
jgi:DNA repair protein RadC